MACWFNSQEICFPGRCRVHFTASVCTLFLDLHAMCWWRVLSFLQIMQLGRQLHVSVPEDGCFIYVIACGNGFMVYVCIFQWVQPCIHVVVSFSWTFPAVVMNHSWVISFYFHNANLHAILYSLLKCLLGLTGYHHFHCIRSCLRL